MYMKDLSHDIATKIEVVLLIINLTTLLHLWSHSKQENLSNQAACAACGLFDWCMIVDTSKGMLPPQLAIDDN